MSLLVFFLLFQVVLGLLIRFLRAPMAEEVTVTVHHKEDADVIRRLATCRRANDSFSRQLRDFAECLENEQKVEGINWQPQPGQILICHFGLGFRPPEMVKTRPVMVISPKTRIWTKLCLVVPISSRAPIPVQNHHFKLPEGLLPDRKYAEAWIKGDTIMAVGCHRLDRLKVRHRQYVVPQAPPNVLKEVRRCVLHATGMQALTNHW
jgi:mRNA interferase MazF